jgi:hypothetical protein
VLADGSDLDPVIERLPSHEALSELVRHSYGPSLVHELGQAAEHLRRSALLASRVPILRLTRPRSFDRLDALVDAIEADVGASAWR